MFQCTNIHAKSKIAHKLRHSGSFTEIAQKLDARKKFEYTNLNHAKFCAMKGDKIHS